MQCFSISLASVGISAFSVRFAILNVCIRSLLRGGASTRFQRLSGSNVLPEDPRMFFVLLPASCPLPRPCVLINAPPGSPRQGNPLPRPASPSRSHPYRPRPQAHCISMPAQSRRLDTTCPTASASGSGSLATRTQQVSASAAQQRASLLQKQLQVWCAIIMIAECNSSLFDLFSRSEQRIEHIKQVVAYFSPFTIQRHCRMWHLWQQFADTHGFSIYDPSALLIF